jgi:hypothetical protein
VILFTGFSHIKVLDAHTTCRIFEKEKDRLEITAFLLSWIERMEREPLRYQEEGLRRKIQEPQRERFASPEDLRKIRELQQKKKKKKKKKNNAASLLGNRRHRISIRWGRAKILLGRLKKAWSMEAGSRDECSAMMLLNCGG